MRFALPCLLFCLAASAEAQQLQIREDQKYMFEAAKHIVQRDFAGAVGSYNQAIALNAANTEAYLQRAVAYRELHNEAGLRTDAAMAVQLTNAAIQRNPNDATAYYQRGTALRLLKRFPEARQNIQYAIQLSGGTSNWSQDLQAITLEEKMN